jgi:hypothetical protein
VAILTILSILAAIFILYAIYELNRIPHIVAAQKSAVSRFYSFKKDYLYNVPQNDWNDSIVNLEYEDVYYSIESVFDWRIWIWTEKQLLFRDIYKEYEWIYTKP